MPVTIITTVSPHSDNIYVDVDKRPISCDTPRPLRFTTLKRRALELEDGEKYVPSHKSDEDKKRLIGFAGKKPSSESAHHSARDTRIAVEFTPFVLPKRTKMGTGIVDATNRSLSPPQVESPFRRGSSTGSTASSSSIQTAEHEVICGPPPSPPHGADTVGAELFGLADVHAPVAQIYHAQHIGGPIAYNSVLKRMSTSHVDGDPMTRDARGKIVPRTDKLQRLSRQKQAAEIVDSPFVLTVKVNDYAGTIDVLTPMAKADLKDVVHIIHSDIFSDLVKTKQLRLTGHFLVALRVAKQSLEQLVRLHGRGMSHNNIKESNLLMDNTLHFYLHGWSSALPHKHLPRGGDWANRRFDSVTGANRNYQKDDLWALGQMLFRIVLGPHDGVLTQSARNFTYYTCPFLPAYEVPGPGRPDGWELSSELPNIAANKKKAAKLHSLWSTMHKAYGQWHSERIAAQKAGRAKVAFPVRRWTEDEEIVQDAERISASFELLSMSEPVMMELCLALLHPDPSEVSAPLLLSAFKSFFDGYFLKAEHRNQLPKGELHLPIKSYSNAFTASLQTLDAKKRGVMQRRLDNERLMLLALEGVRGVGTNACIHSTTDYYKAFAAI